MVYIKIYWKEDGKLHASVPYESKFGIKHMKFLQSLEPHIHYYYQVVHITPFR